MQHDLIYDVGLHMGEDTWYYLKKGFRVVAVEANAQLVGHCKERFAWAIKDGRLVIIEKAVAPASSGDKVTFFQNREASIWGTIDSNWDARNSRHGTRSEAVEVPRVDMREVFKEYGIPYFLKIDIEGADTLVIESLRHFDDRPRFLSIESEKVDFEKLLLELKMLSECGYTKFKAVQQRSIPGTVIKGKTLQGGEFEHCFEEGSSGPFGDDQTQEWLKKEDVIKVYEDIFFQYRYFGDDTVYRKLPRLAKGMVATAYKLATGHRGYLPGWYDTHATL